MRLQVVLLSLSIYWYLSISLSLSLYCSLFLLRGLAHLQEARLSNPLLHVEEALQRALEDSYLELFGAFGTAVRAAPAAQAALA